MKIDRVDFFYLSMPVVRAIGDGSQDALLVRIQAGNYEGWGESESSPLVSIAGFVCPMSHGACQPVCDSVLGQTLESVEDIYRIHRLVLANSLDLLQTDHILSGIDIALWDLLGQQRQVPCFQLLGYKRAYPKLPYASQLFGDSPQETFAKARRLTGENYRAAKFGWGPYGHRNLKDDEDQVAAAREGLGADAMLLVDAGTVWVDDTESAAARLDSLERAGATWLEEPFVSGALQEYSALARKCRSVKLAGGEGSHNFYMAKNMIDHASLGFVQIDAGRVGGMTTAARIARYAESRRVKYVNHTFTSNLALSASLQPYAGLEQHDLCEFPTELSPLARTITREALAVDGNGYFNLPSDRPGLGVEVNLETIQKYSVEVEIRVQGKVIFCSQMNIS
jgi:L-alanine-DL-glutamate epimerase-like enolase superfamily enzyme